MHLPSSLPTAARQHVIPATSRQSGILFLFQVLLHHLEASLNVCISLIGKWSKQGWSKELVGNIYNVPIRKLNTGCNARIAQRKYGIAA